MGLFTIVCLFFLTTAKEDELDGLVWVVLLEALAVRFVWFGESGVNPRVIQAPRMGGPGRGYGEG